ncbi:hypothetical protein P175DRAFT_0157082 [Aspergillus ochraceoroseus IBT 24754]|uniref:SH3 domain-containing protein n=3 Tax=Aspergillus subgen. Nidulantes TaxID=2720870 RepID=A0A0F8W6G8_9EURO|nr:uncharacterized protein P175DRAFT_0157082 [Aspergillus ochraceoroseus IBT 24754]KKK13465.1 hypothetical protein ARAM_002304 [Aspergillus rambellii]KKK24637.1 hypothetical protein AOCH_001754 [Aspergillus ochraceoroseus]PTU23088.1 hypothetical protein P175DRAFT_0157082 [Aspergillus ochraceoroseus IBT 24754]
MAHGHGHHHGHGEVLKRSPGDAVHIVYVTASATFDGPIGGYLTQTDADSTTTSTTKNSGVGQPVQQTKTTTADESTTTKSHTHTAVDSDTTTKDVATKTTHMAETTKATATTGNTAIQTTLSTATSSANSASDDIPIVTSTIYADQYTATSSSSAVAANSGSSEMSTGAKTGIAIGAVFVVALIAGLIFLLVWNKKKKQQPVETLDETDRLNEKKSYEGYNTPPVVQAPPQSTQPMTPSDPPQLNVRPVTQFAPDLTPAQGLTGLSAVGAGAAFAPAAAAHRNLTGNPSPPLTPQSSVSNRDPFCDPANPFDNQAELPSPVSAKDVSPSTPVSAAATTSGPSEAAIGSAVTVAAAAAHHSADKDLLNRPPSAGSEGSAGPGQMQTNVHRVQMDFKPSMDDELELHAGQLVRLLHEYDDGWALCVKLDRSQQGVVPRSCISTRPMKPRSRLSPGPGPLPTGHPGPRGPAGPPGPPGSPMMGPPGRKPQPPRFYPQDGGRPASPSHSMSPARPMPPARPRSPAHGPYGSPPSRPYPQGPMSSAQFPPVPKPYSPGPRQGPPRSMSPGPYGPPGLQRPEMPAVDQRKRSNSMGGAIGQSPRVAPGSSPLATPTSPPPSAALPAIPTSSVPVAAPAPS